MPQFDHIIIGSGINALVCAAMLTRDKRVLVLERESVVGGTIRSGELAPGFTYDPLAMTFVLFHASPAFGALAGSLARHGVTFSATDRPTGVLTSDGASLVFTTDRAANAAALDALHPGDGAIYEAEMATIEAEAPMLFGLLNNELWRFKTLAMLARRALKGGPKGLKTFFGGALITNRQRLAQEYGGDVAAALFAPWPLHAGMNGDQPFSGKMGALMTFALETFGAPVVTGGAARFAEAMRAIIESRRGVVRTGAEVDEILEGTEGRAVRGVRLKDGEEIVTPSVICSLTPKQLYGHLLRNWDLPDFVAKELKRYPAGKANMQLHYALEKLVAWPDPALQSVQLLHLSDGIDAVSKATNEAERGMLPAVPTVCVGQPTAADPSRAPDGKAVLWVQLPECPVTIKGDAAGEIAAPADGAWTEAVREAYADRVEAIIAAHVPGFKDTIIARRAYSPADISQMNVNLEGGDPYGGWCGLDKLFLFRPFPQQINHKAFVPGVHHIGASTHPGPGLHGTSGYLVAKRLAPMDVFG